MPGFDIDKLPRYSVKVEGDLSAIETDYQEKKRAAQGEYRKLVGVSAEEQRNYEQEVFHPAIIALAEKRHGEKKIITDKETPMGIKGM